jgi:pyruvate dehydrogenase E2 component (dihydrolipoamide acetyltransferase)
MDVLMPQLGETVTEGTISTWFKKAGDRIEAGENLLEIETDKVSMEVQAIESGIVSQIVYAAGETAPVGAIIAVIGDGKQQVAPQAKRAAPAVKAVVPSPKPAQAVVHHTISYAQGSLAERGFAPFNEVFTPTRNFGRAEIAQGIRTTPLARRLISQHGVDANRLVAQVRSQGRGRIAAADVQAAMADHSQSFSQSLPITGPRECQPLNRIRQQTAKHLTRAWQSIPHVFQTIEIDFGAVLKLRDQHKEAWRAQHGASLTYLPFIARAVCLAIRQWPRVNSSIDGDTLLVASEINLGIAVDLAHEGLVVPVIKGADGMNVAGLALAIQKLSEKARSGKLTPDNLEGATYTISNNGSFGTLFTAPLINAPQAAILSTDAIVKRAVVVETEFGEAIVARPIGIVAQSFDHRAFDGAYSASFLAAVKSIIETRDWTAEF